MRSTDWSILKGNIYGSAHEGVAVLLPGFAISWQQNQEARQPHLPDLTHILDDLTWLVLCKLPQHTIDIQNSKLQCDLFKILTDFSEVNGIIIST